MFRSTSCSVRLFSESRSILNSNAVMCGEDLMSFWYSSDPSIKPTNPLKNCFTRSFGRSLQPSRITPTWPMLSGNCSATNSVYKRLDAVVGPFLNSSQVLVNIFVIPRSFLDEVKDMATIGTFAHKVDRDLLVVPIFPSNRVYLYHLTK